MSSGVHDFAIPHEDGTPARDMIVVRMPLPPKKIGSFLVPDIFRDMAVHSVMAGRVVKMGPLAFTYKDATGTTQRQDVKIGDWVVIRPFAGTLLQGGKIQPGGWRYLSSFQDVLSILPASKMPDPTTLLWDEDEGQQAVEGAAVDPAKEAASDFDYQNRK